MPPHLDQGDSLQICVGAEDNYLFEVGKIKDVAVCQKGTKVFDYVISFVDSYWAETFCIAINTSASK